MLLGAAVGLTGAYAADSQPTSSADAGTSTVRGVVRDTAGKPVADVEIRLERTDESSSENGTTTADGSFELQAVSAGAYVLTAQKAGWRSRRVEVTVDPAKDGSQSNNSLEIVLESEGSKLVSSNPVEAMEFADKPNFTVAGVVDWTAVGGHGSDATLRTTEALSRETLTLKPEDDRPRQANAIQEAHAEEKELQTALATTPKSFEANHRLGAFYLRSGRFTEAVPLLTIAFESDPANQENGYDLAVALKESGDFPRAHGLAMKLLSVQENASVDRLAAEVDEKLGNPLPAVHEFERAARLDPSEQNYFEWGSELLLHRAVWQAKDVFEKGVAAYPKSARMLDALGTALFAGARYDEAATQLCAASDLDPSNPEPYLFMGKAEIAAPAPLACIEQRLERFVMQQPGNSLANYFYAMAILKHHEQSPDPHAYEQAEVFLTRAVAADSKCADGYLQLGILSSSRREHAKAIGFYSKAIEANPNLVDAHYRLAMAYDRVGQHDKAKQEFDLHDRIEKQEAAEVEEQRRDVKQFLVVLEGRPDSQPVR
jgi:tetratricopeptide (TPR) repeat protein